MRGWWGLIGLAACGGDPEPVGRPGPADTDPSPPTTAVDEWSCVLDAGPVGCEAADSAPQIGCAADFDALASLPLDASIPGARSIKTLVDRTDGDRLYFQNSVKYPIHWDFAFNHLGAQQGMPPVPDLGSFNASEYYSPDRRFILGAVIYYEEPDLWTYEIAPYDTASAELVTTAFDRIRENAWFGPKLRYHPSSVLHQDQVVPNLGADVPIVTTEELFVGVEQQTYNPGETTGVLRFYTADEVDGVYTPFRELVVLDAIPNEISIVAGIITAEFQTPLSHINVLSVNRGTPNMALRDAWNDPRLRALEGKWVRLVVEPFGWTIEEISSEEAESWWQGNKPEPLAVPELDLTVADLRDVEDIIADGNDLRAEVDHGLTVFGSKGTNYAAIYDIDPVKVPIQDAFVIPFYWYDLHMRSNGLQARLETMLAGPDWADPAHRAEALEAFKQEIVAAPLDPQLLAMVREKSGSMWPGENTRFRSSTNAEDLGTFTGAGIYNSVTGDPEVDDPAPDSIAWAIKSAWSNLWNPRAYEERAYYSIDQLGVAMALLTTPNFPDEEANGVAITNNIFDTSGLEPAFFVNVQTEDYEVVQPGLGLLPDSYIHYFYTPGQPVVYITHSNLIPVGDTVLTPQQSNTLGVALDLVHQHFLPVYGLDGDWYGLDVEFKFDDKYTDPDGPDGPLAGEPQLFVKQARPFPWTPGGAPLSVCDP